MNVNLELYRIFYVVAKEKNMTRASEELHISQPAISQSIKKLEEQLGGILFLRSNKGMELTEEGRMFYNYVKGALELIESAENEFTAFKKLSVGKIRIGCSTTLTKIILLDCIKQFHYDYPNIDINITNDLTSNLINDLKLGKLDFVIFNEGEIDNINLALTKIKELKYGFVYNPNYYIDKIKDFNDLNKYDLILQKRNSNTRNMLDNLVLKYSVNLSPKVEVVSQDLIIDLTNIGLGIGFVNIDMAIRKCKDFKELKINKLIPKTNVYLATNKSLSLTFATKMFINNYLKLDGIN